MSETATTITKQKNPNKICVKSSNDCNFLALNSPLTQRTSFSTAHENAMCAVLTGRRSPSVKRSTAYAHLSHFQFKRQTIAFLFIIYKCFISYFIARVWFLWRIHAGSSYVSMVFCVCVVGGLFGVNTFYTVILSRSAGQWRGRARACLCSQCNPVASCVKSFASK